MCPDTLLRWPRPPHTEQLSASELKKLQRKQKKAQLKAQAAKAAEERSKESKPHGKGGSSEEDRKGDEKEAKFDGAKLLQVRESSGFLFHTHVCPCCHTPMLSYTHAVIRPCCHTPMLSYTHAVIHPCFHAPISLSFITFMLLWFILL